ncbi:MAG: hypothetical protein AAFR90_15140 [Pseudomonadota bacterium]
MFEPDENGNYATVQVSQARRFLAYGMQFLLGALLIYTTLSFPPAVPWMLFMLGFGVFMLWQAERLRRATSMMIFLTANDVRDSSGAVLATISEVESVERSAFALKPSHGFTMVLKDKKPRAWAPGLWWRIGRRVGVGGVTNSGQAKFMAEQIALRIK